MSFAQGTPSVNTLINSSNCIVLGNTTSGTALTVQQLGAGAVMNVATSTGSSALFVSSTGQVGVGTASPGAPLDVFKSTNQIFVASSDTSGVYPKVAIGAGGGFDRNAYLNIYGTESSAQTGLSSNHVMTITNFSGSGYNSGDAPSSICFRQRWWSAGSGIEAVGGLRGIKTSTDGNTGGGVQLLYFSSTLQPGLTLNNSGNVGIGLTGPSYQLDLSADGARKLTTTTWLTGSDQRIKTDIQSANLQMCYDTVKSIDLKYFKWNFPTESNVVPDDKHSLGFIAQEVKTVFPNAVSESNSYGYSDFLSLNTDQILKAMYGALKQTMADKEALEQSLETVQAETAGLAAQLQTIEQRLAAAGL